AATTVAITPMYGPPGASRPRSMPCWIATGTAARPIIPTTDSASVPPRPTRSSGESARPRLIVCQADSFGGVAAWAGGGSDGGGGGVGVAGVGVDVVVVVIR